MFHLFGTVYLVPEWRCDTSQPRIVISKRVGTNQTIDNINRLKERGTALVDVKYWGQIAGRKSLFNNDLNFFKYVHTRSEQYPKLKIYVDNEAWNIIFIKWMRILFGNLPHDTAWALYNLTSMHIKHRQPNRDYSWNGFTEEAIKFRLSFLLDWFLLDKEQFIQLYKKTQLDFPREKYFPFLKQVVDGLSIEWLIANYLYDGSFEQQLGEKMFKIVKNTVNEEAHNVRMILINNVGEKWLQDALGYKWDGSLDLQQVIDSNKYLQFLFDLHFNPSDSEFIMKYPEVDLGFMFEVVEKFAQSHVKVEEGGYSYFDPRYSIFDTLSNRTRFDKNQIDMMLESDRKSTLCLFDNNDLSKVNVILVRWLYVQSKETLQQLKIDTFLLQDK